MFPNNYKPGEDHLKKIVGEEIILPILKQLAYSAYITIDPA